METSAKSIRAQSGALGWHAKGANAKRKVVRHVPSIVAILQTPQEQSSAAKSLVAMGSLLANACICRCLVVLRFARTPIGPAGAKRPDHTSDLKCILTSSKQRSTRVAAEDSGKAVSTYANRRRQAALFLVLCKGHGLVMK